MATNTLGSQKRGKYFAMAKDSKSSLRASVTSVATNRVEHSKTVDCNAKLAMINLESLVFLVEMLRLNLAMTDNENFTIFQSRHSKQRKGLPRRAAIPCRSKYTSISSQKSRILKYNMRKGFLRFVLIRILCE